MPVKLLRGNGRVLCMLHERMPVKLLRGNGRVLCMLHERWGRSFFRSRVAARRPPPAARGSDGAVIAR